MTKNEHRMSADVMTVDQVAEYLGFSRHGVTNMLARGEIPGAIRFGRRWRISRAAFMRAVHGELADEQAS